LLLFGIESLSVAPCGEDAIWARPRQTTYLLTGIRRIYPALERIRKFMLHLGEIDAAEKIAGELPRPDSAVPGALLDQPDPMRNLMTAILPKRMVDRIHRKRLGLLPSA